LLLRMGPYVVPIELASKHLSTAAPTHHGPVSLCAFISIERGGVARVRRRTEGGRLRAGSAGKPLWRAFAESQIGCSEGEVRRAEGS
jgi:hypothetical protein